LILAFGVLVLLFVAYQLWGTGLYTRARQSQLRAEFNRELAHLHQRSPRLPTPSTPTTTTTVPFEGVVEPVPGDVPADGQPVGTIVIPKIGADYVVVQGVSTTDLELGPGHYPGTPLPGQPGNAAIAGHRTTYLAPFANINELQPGDPIYVTTVQGRFEYLVTRSLVVDPSDVAVLDPTSTPTLTLTTCNPRYSAAQRLVVQATLYDPSPPTPTPRAPIRELHSSQRRSPASAAARTALAGNGSGVGGAVGWGLACVALFGTAWWVIRRRSRRFHRWAIGVAAALGLLVLLFFFFASLSQLLPASF